MEGWKLKATYEDIHTFAWKLDVIVKDANIENVRILKCFHLWLLYDSMK